MGRVYKGILFYSLLLLKGSPESHEKRLAVQGSGIPRTTAVVAGAVVGT